ncbi:ABC transporter substrate-binding protein [Castellaniella daejeonensis]|jgi:branched-chain amino acid transport system substrate-binding protein|uniref:ABC transporter substrate-binding protein n=1 Tax=Castellaniella daejeonensis TaxID=659013 RepID=A0ABP3DQ25_9BURK|nr:ABC transporter substrate-binding protein [Castellaniella sp.]HET8704472.1 ABC transporter substrate-binding protein [Castellaniella sp.]
MKLRTLSVALAAAGLGFGLSAQAAGISDDVIRIGFIADMSGVYADIDGNAGADAIRMAIADMGGEINGKKIELLTADHQNKADIASARAREWFDQQHLDMLIGGTNSATALAMAAVAAEKKKPFMVVGAGSSALTNAQCTPYTVHYAYNTVALANGTGSAVVREGGKSWFYLTADYAFGHSLEQDTMKVVEKSGGKNLGAVRAPLATTDFSSFLLQAQSSGAEVLGLANAGGDFINSVKAAKEFGITNTMKLAGLLVFINDVHALGLENTTGLYLTTAWYWNQDDASRAWSKRFFEKHDRAPSFLQAGDYSAAKTYLEAVKAIGTDDGDAIMKQLKSVTVNDMFIKNGHIRKDGLMMHDMYLAQVKKPDQSKAAWDYYNIVRTLPAESVFGAESTSTCALK